MIVAPPLLLGMLLLLSQSATPMLISGKPLQDQP